VRLAATKLVGGMKAERREGGGKDSKWSIVQGFF
jgi:hypothetical protein